MRRVYASLCLRAFTFLYTLHNLFRTTHEKYNCVTLTRLAYSTSKRITDLVIQMHFQAYKYIKKKPFSRRLISVNHPPETQFYYVCVYERGRARQKYVQRLVGDGKQFSPPFEPKEFVCGWLKERWWCDGCGICFKEVRPSVRTGLQNWRSHHSCGTHFYKRTPLGKWKECHSFSE